MKTIRWLSVAIAIAYLLFLEVIGSYLNPFVLNAYRGASVDIPEAVFRVAQFDAVDAALVWLIIAIVLFGKDYFTSKRTALMMNLAFLIGLVPMYVYYFVTVDLIHMPLP